jgi:hypothetical protein
MWVIFGILGVNTAFALQTLTLAPGATVMVEASIPTEVRCQGGASTAEPCTPVPERKNPSLYQIKVGQRVHPGVYYSLFEVSHAMKTFKESGICL